MNSQLFRPTVPCPSTCPLPNVRAARTTCRNSLLCWCCHRFLHRNNPTQALSHLQEVLAQCQPLATRIFRDYQPHHSFCPSAPTSEKNKYGRRKSSRKTENRHGWHKFCQTDWKKEIRFDSTIFCDYEQDTALKCNFLLGRPQKVRKKRQFQITCGTGRPFLVPARNERVPESGIRPDP